MKVMEMITPATTNRQAVDSYVGSMSKIDRYKWLTSNRPGVFTMIAPWDIEIDRTYQRDANLKKVIEIAKNWNWVACGCISVVRRPDGTYVAPDGGHRILAACKRSDITELPCLVWDMSDLRDEAAAFLALNTLRKPVEAVDKYKAALVAGEANAILVQKVLEANGYSVQRGDAIQAVGGIAGLLKSCSSDPDLFADLIKLSARIAGGGRIQSAVFQGLEYIEKTLRARDDHRSIFCEDVVEKLVKIGMEGLAISCRRAAQNSGSGGSRTWGLAIHCEINKAKRSLKIDPI